MTVKANKIVLIPVQAEEEVEYQVERVLTLLAPAVKIIDEHSQAYEHETPWKMSYAGEAKYYLFRVKIGVIGRISNCTHAATLGVCSKDTAHSFHFANMGIFYVFRVARLYRRELLLTRKVENWVNNLLGGVAPNSRRQEYESNGKE